jgi:AraC-like DNA-binding protein
MPIAADVYKKIVTAKVFIDENFREPIDLDLLSREACLSRYHFHRLFTRIYQITPHQYLTRKRIGQARQSLAGKDFTIMEICNDIGFESIGSFSSLFKKENGYAPLNYRRRAWHKEQQAQQQPRSFIPHCFIENFAFDEKSNIQEMPPDKID